MEDPETLLAQRLKSKTYWLGIFVLTLTYLQENFALVDDYLGEYQNLISFAIGLLIMICREATTMPLSQKSNARKT